MANRGSKRLRILVGGKVSRLYGETIRGCLPTIRNTSRLALNGYETRLRCSRFTIAFVQVRVAIKTLRSNNEGSQCRLNQEPARFVILSDSEGSPKREILRFTQDDEERSDDAEIANDAKGESCALPNR